MRQLLAFLLPLTALAAGLPVKQVVLFKNGVGYFVRSGEIENTGPARLEFRTNDMNDVLKSLTVSSRGGGVAQVRYDSNEPLARKLADFPFTLKDKLTLSSFLDELKGARVELRFGPESLSGTIVSARTTPPDKDHPEKDVAVLLLESGELRTVDLSAAQSVRFADPRIQSQLAAYLALLNQSGSKDRRTVYIDAAPGAREITARYMAPSAVWKSSYRLLFADNREPSLEGWAIVDNTSGEDWSGISLALVSGRPVSFVSQLYDPKYVERRTAELAENAPVGPAVHEGAVALAAPAAPVPKLMGVAGARMYAADSASRADVVVREQVPLETSTVAAMAEGRDAGELFEYAFPHTVTIRQGESAMLPFLQQTVSARKLLIFTGEGTNPLSAAELTNTTDKTLDGGPITVFDANSYTGEALMETLKPGDKRIISYAVDQGTRITTAFDSSSEVVREVHLRRGVLTTRSSVQETRTYTIRNVDQKPKVLVIEHPVRPEYKLVNQKPVETTAHAQRFEVKLGPASTETFPVVEQRLLSNSLAVSSYTQDALLSFVQNRSLGEKTRKQLEKIAAQKREIAENDAALARATEEYAEMGRDQERLRQNLDSLNRVAGQGDRVQQYARDLAASDVRMASLRDTRGELQTKKARLEKELAAIIESAEF